VIGSVNPPKRLVNTLAPALLHTLTLFTSWMSPSVRSKSDRFFPVFGAFWSTGCFGSATDPPAALSV
jgi:hypothetical protein